MRFALSVAALALFAAGPLAAQHVAVRAGARMGRGLTYLRGNQCFVITPRHVVGDANEIEIIGARSSRAAARPELDLPHDLALLRVTSGDTELCTPWGQNRGIEGILASARDATLRYRGEDGGTDQLPVYVIGSDFQHVRVRPVTGEIAQGMSGSAVVVGSTTVAVLLQADVGGGVGTAIRVDRIDDVIQPYLSSIVTNPGPPATYQDSVCAAVTRLLASAKGRFADIIGDPWITSGNFYATVLFPRHRRGWVNPRGPYYSSGNSAPSQGQAEAAARRMNHAVNQCIPGWTSSEKDSPSRDFHHFIHRDPVSATEIEVRYQTRYNASVPNTWSWGIAVYAPRRPGDPRIR